MELERERTRARYFGFLSLTVWSCLGIGLESAHAFKLSAYLDHPLRRELLIWSHAHGVGLALIVLTYAAHVVDAKLPARPGQLLRAASLLMPLGFALAIFGHGEADPGPAIWLVPIGALVLVAALVSIVRALPKP